VRRVFEVGKDWNLLQGRCARIWEVGGEIGVEVEEGI